MIIETLVVGMIQANCFIVADEISKQAVVIDPGGDAPVIAKRVKELGLDVVALIATHGHFDHVEGLGELKKELGDPPIYIHAEDVPLMRNTKSQGAIFGLNVKDSPDHDHEIDEATSLKVGQYDIKVLHTPGHSPGSVCLLINGNLFAGDLIFQSSIGRTDLTGGDYDTLMDSVRQKIFTLPDETVIHPGHGPATSVGREKMTNPFFR